MIKLASKFGVSSSYMARICKLLNVPRPERGYWAKLAVGRAPLKPVLPDPRPGDELAWVREKDHSNVIRPLPRPPTKRKKRKSKLNSAVTGPHPLIQGVKVLFETGRFKSENGYLRPDKRNLVDLIISKESLDKGLAFADELFINLERSGHRVLLEPKGEEFHRAEVDEHEQPRNKGYNNMWSPWRCTVVYIGTVAIGLTIIELSEEVEVRYVNGTFIRERDYFPPKRGRYSGYNWKTTKDFPTGRLCLQAYSPYKRANWVKQWRETKDHDLRSQIKKIIKELEQAVPNIARLVEEGEIQAEIERREWEAQKEKWRKEEQERRAAKALKESRTELLKIIENWAEANRIEQFFQAAEKRIAELSESERNRFLDRLKRARELIISTDALDNLIRWKSPDELDII